MPDSECSLSGNESSKKKGWKHTSFRLFLRRSADVMGDFNPFQ